MIIPITMPSGGEIKNIGTASVEPVDGDFEVEFYLNPGFVIRDQTKCELEKQLKEIARRRNCRD